MRALRKFPRLQGKVGTNVTSTFSIPMARIKGGCPTSISCPLLSLAYNYYVTLRTHHSKKDRRKHPRYCTP